MSRRRLFDEYKEVIWERRLYDEHKEVIWGRAEGYDMFPMYRDSLDLIRA